MASIDIKGVRIGEGRPKTIVSLMADASSSSFVYELERLTTAGIHGTPDCVEWRADFSRTIHDPQAVAGSCFFLSEELDTQPLIFTCRTVGQGGRVEMSPREYLYLCRTIIEQGGPDLIDIELGIGENAVGELVALAHERGVRTIVSHHDFQGTPETSRMVEMLEYVASLGADIPKLAVMARSPQDARRLMRATSEVASKLDAPLLTLAMGSAGAITRVTGEVFGSAATFCALSGNASAPGQVELARALSVMEALHEVAAGT